MKKLLLTIALVVCAFIYVDAQPRAIGANLGYGASFSLITLIKNKLKFVFRTELLFAKPVLITTAVIFAICLIIFLFVFIKYKFIGYTEMIESNTELNSKLYGSSHWQSKKEMDKN